LFAAFRSSAKSAVLIFTFTWVVRLPDSAIHRCISAFSF
jgi:hypothetical protein